MSTYKINGQSTIILEKGDRKAFKKGLRRAKKCPSFKLYKHISFLFPQLVVWKCIVDNFILDRGFDFYVHCSNCKHQKEGDLGIQVLAALLPK